jgi:hypothetical protein
MTSRDILIKFNDECKEIPLLTKLRFSTCFDIEIIEHFQLILINSSIFPNLKTIEFEDLTFTFRNNQDLISFF